MFITLTLGQASPVHYKNFPPEHRALAKTKAESTVHSEKPEQPKVKPEVVATQTEKPKPAPKPVPVPPPVRASGTCADWIAQAGITATSSVMALIGGESGCRPYAQNPTSTAYGIGQFLNSTWATVGCVKSSDPVYQLKCMQKYIYAVYGTWENAYATWLSRSPHWY